MKIRFLTIAEIEVDEAVSWYQKGLEGSYLSTSGERIPDGFNLLYSDAPLALSTDFL